MVRLRGIAAVLTLVCATPVWASDATASLEINGRVSPRCSIVLGETNISVQLTEAGGTRSIPFSVDCNQRMNVEMTSRHGGFSHVTHRRGEEFAGFSNFISYQAQFNVAANGAAPVIADSSAMRTGAGGSIGVTPYQANGTLGVTWQPSQPLLGGEYIDVIEIRVSGG